MGDEYVSMAQVAREIGSLRDKLLGGAGSVGRADSGQVCDGNINIGRSLLRTAMEESDWRYVDFSDAFLPLQKFLNRLVISCTDEKKGR